MSEKATMPAPATIKGGLSAAERKRLIEHRCRESIGWRIIHWLGSLHLALILLASIAIACAIATFAESEFNAKIAQAYIYKAPWFILWLGVLCVNLFAVTLTRIPWEKRHTGFIVTHYGIITMLIGAVIGLHTGFEGNVTLRKDQPPTTRVTTSRSIIQVESPADSFLYIKSFDAELARPSEQRPRAFPVPGTDLRIVADDYAPSLVREPRLMPSTNPDAAPAVVLRLWSEAVGQDVRIPLVLRGGQPAEEDFFGLATIRLASELPPDRPTGPSEPRMVFAKFAPVASEGGRVSDAVVRLSEDGSRVTITRPDGVGATYLREEIMRRPITEAGATVIVEEYWPHFSMQNGRPVSLSTRPENPAILVRVGEARTGDSDTMPVLALQVEGEGVAYALMRDGMAYARGGVEPGGPINLGWADWRAELVAASPSAVIAEEVGPGDIPPGDELPTPGFRARLEGPDGQRGPDRWVESGRVTSLTDGRNVVRLGYGLETRPLPFSIRLLSFDVPRDEGTDRPANFLATVEFRDNQTGETKAGVAEMNRPASFPGTLAANLTGINYKFSQAEWNPRNLDETTLQVLYDPGWLLKWFGSLAICVGIFIQFYLKPR
jgi:hypothetical protein